MFTELFKANPYHDKLGRFAAKAGATYVSIGGVFDKQRVKANSVVAAMTSRRKQLKVPPAWKSVWINPDPKGALQATGIDGKGRKQYLYSKEHSEKAAAEKFARLKDFNAALPGIRKNLSTAMKTSPNDNVAVLRLIERTGIRIGSDAETGGKVKAYGATTLLAEHVRLGRGNTIKLDFPGKHGIRNTREFEDKALHAYLSAKILAGETRLFKTSDASARNQLQKLGGKGFSPKDFRTYHGTAQALKFLSTATETGERLKSATAKHVSSYLGNTPKVALEAYIDPAVFLRPRTTVKKADPTGELDRLIQEYLDTTQYDQPAKHATEPEED